MFPTPFAFLGRLMNGIPLSGHRGPQDMPMLSQGLLRDYTLTLIALSTTYSFVLFSSLNNLKTASLTGIPRAGKETFPGERLLSPALFTALYPAGLPASTGAGRAELNQMLTQPYLLGCEIADLWAGRRE